jgi:hypothetical protein
MIKPILLTLLVLFIAACLCISLVIVALVFGLLRTGM